MYVVLWDGVPLTDWESGLLNVTDIQCGLALLHAGGSREDGGRDHGHQESKGE